jgi:tetratricopeptide (TPR) repeat protein
MHKIKMMFFLIFFASVLAQTEEEEILAECREKMILTIKMNAEEKFEESLQYTNELISFLSSKITSENSELFKKLALDLRPTKEVIKTPDPFLEKARKDGSLEKVLQISRMLRLVYSTKSRIHQKKNDYVKALEALNTAIEYRPDFPSDYKRSIKLNIHFGNMKNVLNALDNLVILEEDYESYMNRGRVRYLMGDFRGSLEDLDKAISLSPEQPLAYLYRGHLYEYRNQLGKALKDYNKVTSLTDDDEIKADAYASRSAIRLALGDLKGALEDCNISIKHDADACNYSYRGNLKFKLGDFEGALEDYNKAVEIDPQSKSYYGTYLERGNFFYEMQDFKSAKQDYLKYLELNTHVQDDFFMNRYRKQAEEKLLLLQYD